VSIILNGENVVPDDCTVVHDGREVDCIVHNGEIVYSAPTTETPVVLPTRIIVVSDIQTITLSVGDEHKITIQFVPEETTERDLLFTSLSPAVLSVTQDGVVTALSKGSIYDFVQINGANGTIAIAMFRVI
jgi:hypothetical protein